MDVRLVRQPALLSFCILSGSSTAEQAAMCTAEAVLSRRAAELSHGLDGGGSEAADAECIAQAAAAASGDRVAPTAPAGSEGELPAALH